MYESFEVCSNHEHASMVMYTGHKGLIETSGQMLPTFRFSRLDCNPVQYIPRHSLVPGLLNINITL